MHSPLDLPSELLILILEQLALPDVFRFCSTCQAARQIFRPDTLIWVVDHYGQHTDAAEWTAVVEKTDRYVLCHALLKLFQPRRSGPGYDALLRHGASFSPVPHGEVLREIWFEVDMDRIEFMLNNGGSLHRVPGGVNQLLEDSLIGLEDFEFDERLPFLTAHGASLQHMPLGLEEVVNTLVRSGYGDDRLFFALENGGTLRYNPKGLVDRLKSLYRSNELSSEVKYLLQYMPGGIHILLGQALIRFGIGSHLDLLLHMGADWRAVPLDGDWTPLALAAANGYLYQVRYLLGKVDVEELDSENRRAIHAAAYTGGCETVQALLDYGAQCNPATKTNGYTPLSHACMMGQTESVTCLLERGADIHTISKSCQTPLHLAAINGHAGAVKILLEWGADKDAVDTFGMTALDYAEEREHEEVSNVLRN